MSKTNLKPFAYCCSSFDVDTCDCVVKDHGFAMSAPVAVDIEDNNIEKISWPDPTPEMLENPLFKAIWEVIKGWDINVPGAYVGYCGATGNHTRAIFDAVKSQHYNDMQEVHKTLAWYGLEAEAINRNLGNAKENKPHNENGVLASLTILSLDSGNRAANAIRKLYGAKAEQVPSLVEDIGSVREGEAKIS